MKTLKFRLDITTAEIAMVCKLEPTTARDWVRKIKLAHGKNKKHRITIHEFCDYKGMPFKLVFCQVNKWTVKQFDEAVESSWLELPEEFL